MWNKDNMLNVVLRLLFLLVVGDGGMGGGTRWMGLIGGVGVVDVGVGGEDMEKTRERVQSPRMLRGRSSSSMEKRDGGSSMKSSSSMRYGN